MPYVSPKDVARARTNLAVAELASSLDSTRIDEQPTQTAESSEPPGGSGSESDEHNEEATETREEPAPNAAATDAEENTPPLDSSEPAPLELSRSHTPDAPSLLSCGTDSTNSLHTLSSVDGDESDTVEIIDPEDDVEIVHEDDDVFLTTPEMAQYHRDIIAFTKPLYDRAKMIVERKLRVQRARGVVC